MVAVSQCVNKLLHLLAEKGISYNAKLHKLHYKSKSLGIFLLHLCQSDVICRIFCIFVHNYYHYMSNNIKIESHPFEPFLPEGARVLMLGTFPPKPERWSMDFFYPNRINDMWRIQGLIFFGDKNYFWINEEKRFDLHKIKLFLTDKKIALYDTATRVRRLKDNASDKFLEIVDTIDLGKFFEYRPTISAIITAGEKATGVIAQKAGVEVPKTGECVECEYKGHDFVLCRMPSTSRAYPLALEKKAEAYRDMFLRLGYEL